MSRRLDEGAARLRGQLEAGARSELEIEEGRRHLLAAVVAPPPKTRAPWLIAAAAVAAAVLLLLLRPVGQDEAGLVVTAGEACVARSEASIRISPCAEAVVLAAGVEAPDLRLEAGRARFVVAKRTPRRRPFMIAVSHGWIVVIGTRFTVEQNARAGRLDVEEGVVEFRWADGAPSERLTAGASLEWPRPAPPAPPPPPVEPPAPPPVTKTHIQRRPPAMTAHQLMRRLFQLESQRRFDEAIALLTEGSTRTDFTEVQRERLSFELSTVLRQAGDHERACRQMTEHLRRFPASPHKAELERLLHDCR